VSAGVRMSWLNGRRDAETPPRATVPRSPESIMPAAPLFMTRGREALHTGTCREPFVADLRRGGEVLGDHGQAIVGVAEQTLCLQDVRDVGIPRQASCDRCRPDARFSLNTAPYR
jgi:hypothetical protein